MRAPILREPSRMPVGPNLVPGLPVVAVSNGAPRKAMSYFSTLSSGDKQWTQGRFEKVLKPEYFSNSASESFSELKGRYSDGFWLLP